MHRAKLRKLLEQYEPSYEEIEYKARMLDFLAEYEACFERSLSIGHFTASAWLLSANGQQALLLHHAKLDMWLQLGGHADGDHNLLAVAIKEAQEESGIQAIKCVFDQIFDIDIHRIPAGAKEAAHDHYDVRFLLQVESDEQVKANKESKALVWVDKTAMKLPTQERSVLRLFEKWQQYP